MQVIEAQVLDAHHLKLSRRLTLPPGSKIFITITPPEDQAIECRAWSSLAAQQLERAYGDQEPDYSQNLIKQRNLEFQP